jgi:hypothetical protein
LKPAVIFDGVFDDLSIDSNRFKGSSNVNPSWVAFLKNGELKSEV